MPLTGRGGRPVARGPGTAKGMHPNTGGAMDPADGPLVSVRDLGKQFGAFTAVQGLSFEARRGEIFGLLGPNGAGKTTTLRMLGTTLSPSSGSAEVAGFEITRHPEQVRRRIGVLTAAIGLYGRLTARENVEYFGRLHGMSEERMRGRIDHLIERLDMAAYADRPAEAFSTGMKQKVALARAIVHDPPVVILDEPTSGLDVLASQIVREFMRSMRAEGRCVLLSTHLMWEAELLCDRIAIVHEGRLVGNDTVDGLKRSTGAANLEEAFLRLVGSAPKAGMLRGEVAG